MKNFHLVARLAALPVVMALLLVGAPARASIELDYYTDTDPTNHTVSVAGNSVLQFSGSVDGFTIVNLTAAGQDAFGGSGELLDVSALVVSTTGSGTLYLRVVEDVTSSAAGYASAFSAVGNNVAAERGFSGTESTSPYRIFQLGQTTQFGGGPTTAVSGGISVVSEAIVIHALGRGANLSSDDSVGLAPVPVPPAAWLLGSGLLMLAGVGRRRGRR